MFTDHTKNNPGPGQYIRVSGEKGGRNVFYLDSRYKSNGSAVISRSGQRFDNNDLRRSREVPGPGQYP